MHNWRDFLKEVGTIVLGVSIALAAEQAVEWWHWRNQVAEARSIIASEMVRNISYSTERLRFARCYQARMTAIYEVLDAALKSGTLPPLGPFPGPRIQPLSSGAWGSLVASQTATHFPREQLAALSLIYKRVERVENWNRQEQEVWSTLHSLSGPGRRFDPAYEAELRKALGIALANNFSISGSSLALVESAQSLDLPFTPEERRQIAEVAKAEPPPCVTLSATPVTGPADVMPEQFLLRLDASRKRLATGAQ
jgi:hypothetical protein